MQKPIVLGAIHGISPHAAAAADDRDLVDGVSPRQTTGDQGVAGFVIGDSQKLFLANHALLALGAGQDTLDPFLEVSGLDAGLPLAGGQQGGLVDEVRKVGTHEAGGHRGDLAEVQLITNRHVADVDLEDLLPAAEVGAIDGDLAIESARTNERRVQRLRPVGGRHDDDAAV